MRPRVAFALALILSSTISGPLSVRAADESASSTPSVSEEPSPLGANEEYLELSISYNPEQNIYSFSGAGALCTPSSNIEWYMGEYPHHTANPQGGSIPDCASAIPLLDNFRYPLATFDGARSITIQTGGTRYVLRYAVTGGILTTPGSSPIDTAAPFRPTSDPINEKVQLPASVTDGIFAVDESVCDLMLSSVGGMGSPSGADVWGKTRNIWVAALRPQDVGSYSPDNWPSVTRANIAYQMRTDFDPGSGNPACTGPEGPFYLYADHMDLEHDAFTRPADGTAYFFFWYSTKTQPGFYDQEHTNARPLGYVALNRTNGVWSIATCVSDCASSVLFLPGIQGSRLYDADGTKLWEPVSARELFSGDEHVRELFLDANGQSINRGIHTKAGDIIDVAGSADIYGSFLQELSAWKSEGIIADWEAIAYDWRLSLDDILNNGAEVNGTISYLTSTSTPYIIQTLRTLASRAPSGKVTIIAHSNGGLLAKALMTKLGEEADDLVDTIILVGVPQSGAPEAVSGILFGQDLSISAFGGVLSYAYVSKEVTRAFAENAPMAYHLLPSGAYFESVRDPLHSVIEFTDQTSYQTERDFYGFLIDTWQELSDYISNKDGGRIKPSVDDIEHPSIGNSSLLAYANTTHQELDAWIPPADVDVYQIAGWGASDTVAGIQFYDGPVLGGVLGTKPMYRPIFTEDGDGVVPTPSALLMSTSSDSVYRYWINLNTSNIENNDRISHSSIFGLSYLRDLTGNILRGSIDFLPKFISSTQPNIKVFDRKLTFFLHSPLTLGILDQEGSFTGVHEDGSIDEDIPNTAYGEFGEVKYIIVPAGGDYKLVMKGQDSGAFSLDIQEQTGNTVTQVTTIANVPTTNKTIASLTISNGVEDASPLTVDEDGDGVTDIILSPRAGEVTIYAPTVTSTSEETNDSNRGSGKKTKSSSSTDVTDTEPRVLGASTNMVIEKDEYRIQLSLSDAVTASGTNQTLTDSHMIGLPTQQGWFSQIFKVLYSRWSELVDSIIRFLTQLLDL